MSKIKEGEKVLLSKEDMVLEELDEGIKENSGDGSEEITEETITREEFMAGVDMTRAILQARREQAAGELAAIEAEMENLSQAVDRMFFAEDSGLRVRFTRTSDGQYGFDAEPKGRCGFMRNGNGK
jgi:hypothetical protein